MKEPPSHPASPSKPDREARLADALRTNLRLRKAQARAKAQTEVPDGKTDQ